jgi:hypothetical protein
MIAFSALEATFSANDPRRALPLGRHLFGTVGNNYGGPSLAVVGGRSIGFQMPNRKERTSADWWFTMEQRELRRFYPAREKLPAPLPARF